MRERLQEFSLSLHPDKTRLIEFGRFAAQNARKRGLGKPETFNFLGFTLICGKSRRGDFLIKRKTRRDRMRAKLREIKEELRRRMHRANSRSRGSGSRRSSLASSPTTPCRPTAPALRAFRYHVTVLWHRTLRRRSQKDAMTWERMAKLADECLPKPRILHPWPSERFAVKHPR